MGTGQALVRLSVSKPDYRVFAVGLACAAASAVAAHVIGRHAALWLLLPASQGLVVGYICQRVAQPALAGRRRAACAALAAVIAVVGHAGLDSYYHAQQAQLRCRGLRDALSIATGPDANSAARYRECRRDHSLVATAARRVGAAGPLANDRLRGLELGQAGAAALAALELGLAVAAAVRVATRRAPDPWAAEPEA
jgi:hypothetical protein